MRLLAPPRGSVSVFGLPEKDFLNISLVTKGGTRDNPCLVFLRELETEPKGDGMPGPMAAVEMDSIIQIRLHLPGVEAII
jgi:hypothetical protein